MRNSKESEDIYIFAKLKGIKNYKEWAKEMRFVFLDADLMVYGNSRLL